MKTKIIKLLISVLAISLFAEGFLSFLVKDDYLNLVSKKIDNVMPSVSMSIFREGVKKGDPFRIRIPSIQVDATLESLGLTSEGAMDTPRGPTHAGWFNLGPRPGENGSAVIDGHFGWKDGIPAVFDNLFKLNKGDKIYVDYENGKGVTFVVRKTKLYDPHADASDVFGSSDGGVHLNLITCEGAWDEVSHSRPDRLVVFADRE